MRHSMLPTSLYSLPAFLRDWDRALSLSDPFFRSERIGAPVARVMEDDDAYTLVAELPGVRPEDVEVDLQRDSLRIRATSESRAAEDDESLREEFRQQRWDFSYRLGGPVDPSQTTAHLENGVLTVTVARSEDQKPRRIEVIGGGDAPRLNTAIDVEEDGESDADGSSETDE